MLDRLEQMEQRYNDLQAQFSLPEVINDHEKYQKTAKTLREIETPVAKYRELKQVQQGLAEARAMLTETDPDLRAMADVSHDEWRLWPRVFDGWLNNILYWELTRTRLPALHGRQEHHRHRDHPCPPA